MNRFGALYSATNVGPEAAFAAPAQDIFTTDRPGAEGYGSGNFVTVSGTSFASPMAAGIAALIFSIDPVASVDTVFELMQSTANKSYLAGQSWSASWGYGVPQAEGAVFPVIFGDGFESGGLIRWSAAVP